MRKVLDWTVPFVFKTILIKSLWDWGNPVPIALVPSTEFITGGYCGDAAGSVGGGQTALRQSQSLPTLQQLPKILNVYTAQRKCVRAPPKLGRYWEIHPWRRRDFPRPKIFPKTQEISQVCLGLFQITIECFLTLKSIRGKVGWVRNHWALVC